MPSQPPQGRLQGLLGSADFLTRCLTTIAVCLVVSVSFLLAVLVCLISRNAALPLLMVVGLSMFAVRTILDKRKIALDALGDVERLVSGTPSDVEAPRVDAHGQPVRRRSKRDMVRGLLDKVVDTAFDSVSMYVFGLPAIALFFAWLAHSSSHDTIAFLCGMLAVLLSLFGFIPYFALRFIVSRQLDAVMDAIPPSSRAASAATEGTPLVK